MTNQLFNEINFKEYLVRRKQDILNSIKAMRISNFNDYYSLAAEFVHSKKIAPLLLQESHIKLISKADDFKGTSPYIPVRLKIPYVGDSLLFTCITEETPTNNAPAAQIADNHIIITLSLNISLDKEKYRKGLQTIIKQINSYIYEVNKQVHIFNKWLDTEVPLLIKERYEYVVTVQKALDSLGLGYDVQ
ncbi:hypothetical protein IMX26_05540 [Clostridium sp. 'deep sea']|uniref:hypothetical protein n=1 Tax=Clostridium sp. 'deep sea' TaxID=2779445 RepID=UPI00189649AF|nr:hypothetical protein [Clostridium sp. 'deep sea']QOR36276.1 hypothetical protein IMX26_05540 [Clostridium sp. 'deep sea']